MTVHPRRSGDENLRSHGPCRADRCLRMGPRGGSRRVAARRPRRHGNGDECPVCDGLAVAGRLSFDLVCRATPSNNVEVAFGTDANGNGVLEPEETDRVVGWDCGSWFTRKGADGACQMENGEWKMENGGGPELRILSWRVRVAADGTPSRFEATADGSPAFADLPLESTYSPSWNLLRLTGRGLDASLEAFTVSVTPDGTTFIMW